MNLKQEIVANPAGTKGFDFLELTTENPDLLIHQLTMLGFSPVARHKVYPITIYQQNDIRFIVNLKEQGKTNEFAHLHGASASAMGFYVENANAAYDHVLSLGAKALEADADNPYHIPAIYGVGGSLIYFVDDQHGTTNYFNEFSYIPVKTTSPLYRPQAGLTYIDHVTHNLRRGNMAKWADFYTALFNFHEIRYFDISGKVTGLKSKAMASPCGHIRIPLNESSDDQSQIEEFIEDFHGEGIQHIALGTDNIYASVERLIQHGIAFLETPDTYYELIEKRLTGHGEPVALLQKLRILIDGTTENEKKLLLQIFTKNMLGPVFFEVIQRKGDEGFGEGNFKG